MKLHLVAALWAACVGFEMTAELAAQQPRPAEPARPAEGARRPGRPPPAGSRLAGDPLPADGYEVRVSCPSPGQITVVEGMIYVRALTTGLTAVKTYDGAVTAEAYQGFPNGAGVPLTRIGTTDEYEGWIMAPCNSQTPYPSFSIATTADFVDKDEVETGDDGGFEGICAIPPPPPPDPWIGSASRPSRATPRTNHAAHSDRWSAAEARPRRERAAQDDSYSVKILYPQPGKVSVVEGFLYVQVIAAGDSPVHAVTAEAYHDMPGQAPVPLSRIGTTDEYEGWIPAPCSSQSPYPCFYIEATADFAGHGIETTTDGAYVGVCAIDPMPTPRQSAPSAEREMPSHPAKRKERPQPTRAKMPTRGSSE